MADEEKENPELDSEKVEGSEEQPNEPMSALEKQKIIQEAEMRAKKRKLIPPFVMLLAGAIVSITLLFLRYSPINKLLITLGVMILFYIIGDAIKSMLDRFEKQIEEARLEEGEVIDKTEEMKAEESEEE